MRLAVLVVAAMALAAPAPGVTEAARARLARPAAGALGPAADLDLDASFQANAAALRELQAAASRKDALLQASSEVTPAAAPAAAEPGSVQPEIQPSAAEVARHRRADEDRAETLTREGRQALEAANRFHAQLLDPHAAQAVNSLVDRLAGAQTFVRLSNPVRGGHLVRYHVVRGNPSAVEAFAHEFGVAATESELDAAPHPDHGPVVRHDAVETNQHVAGVVPAAAGQGAAGATPANFPDFVDKEVSRGERLELAANNHHEVAKLACPVCEKFAALTFRLAREDTFVRLYSAIPHGHTVDYELVRGARAAVLAVAAEVGLQADHTQLTAAPASGADAVHAEAEVTHGFEAVTTNEGAGEPIN